MLNAWTKRDPVTKLGQGPVAVGSPLTVMVLWHGDCEHGKGWPELGVGRGHDEYACQHVDHVMTVECAGACRLERGEEAYVYSIVPTRTGELRATVTVTGQGLSKRFALDPLQVVTPTSAEARCVPPTDGGRYGFDVQLHYNGAPLEDSRPPLVRVKHGDDCLTGALFEWKRRLFACAIGSRKRVELEILGPGYALATTADCEAPAAGS